MTKRDFAILTLALAIAPGWAAAEVLDSSAAGFTVKETIQIQAPPQDVYARIFHIADWWNSTHTFSQDAHNLSLEEKVGGCFCEKFPAGGGVKHMEVVYLMPSKQIVLHGALGPMQTMAANGSMLIQLSAANGGTKLEVTYAVGGYTPNGLVNMGVAVDGVLKDMFTRLKSLIEKGDPAAK